MSGIHSPAPARVLVGILYSNEPQLALLMDSILRQHDVDLGYFIISGRNKKDAHNALYGHFLQYQSDYDVLAKLDADMVVQDSQLFSAVSRELAASPQADLLMLPVFDYFTNSNILGANFFRAGIFRFSQRDDGLFTDRMASDVTTMVTSIGFHRPILHCPAPAAFQAYHFGVHRGLKLRHAVEEGDQKYSRNHFRTLGSLATACRDRPTRQRALAYYGLTSALSGKFDEADVSYTVSTVRDDFLRTATYLSTDSMMRMARMQRALNSLRSLRLARREVRLWFDRIVHGLAIGRLRGAIRGRGMQ